MELLFRIDDEFYKPLDILDYNKPYILVRPIFDYKMVTNIISGFCRIHD